MLTPPKQPSHQAIGGRIDWSSLALSRSDYEVQTRTVVRLTRPLTKLSKRPPKFTRSAQKKLGTVDATSPRDTTCCSLLYIYSSPLTPTELYRRTNTDDALYETPQ